MEIQWMLTLSMKQCPYKNSAAFTLENSLFGVSNGKEFGKNEIIFGTDMSLSTRIDSNEKDILILDKDPTQGLDDTTLTTKKGYSVSFIEQQKKYCVSSHHHGTNGYLFANGVEI